MRSRTDTRRGLSIAHRVLWTSFFLVGFVQGFGASPKWAWAQDEPPEEAAFSPDDPSVDRLEETDEGDEGVIDRAHRAISNRVMETAERIDSFLGDDRIVEESNRSLLKLSVARISNEDGLEVRRQIKLKLVLPKLRNRLHLVISGEDDEVDGLPAPAVEGRVADLEAGTPSSDVTSAIRLMLRSTRKLNIFIDGGVRVRLHPTIFARARYRQSVALDHWVMRLTQSVKWEEAFSEKPFEWEAISQIAFERQLTPRYLFRISLQGSWFEGRHGYFVHQGFALAHQISKRRVLVYEWNTLARTGRIVETVEGVETVAEDEKRLRIEEFGPKLRYRQTVGWPWLFFEFDPEVAYRRDLDSDHKFDGVWRFLVKLEIQFRDRQFFR